MPIAVSPLRRLDTAIVAAPLQAAATLVVLVTLYRLATLAFGWVPIYADEAQYWSWSDELAFGYFSKPPMIAWIVWLTTAMAGDGSFGVRLSIPLIHATTAMTLFWVGRSLVSDRVGFWAAVTYVTLPGVSVSSLVLSVDPPLLMFWAFCLAAVIKAEGGGSTATTRPMLWWTLAGVAAGLAMLTKYAAIALPASLLLYLVLGRRWQVLTSAGPYAFLAAMIVVFSPNILWNLTTGFVSVTHVVQDGEYGGDLLNPGEMLEFLGSQFGVFGPILFGALLYAVARWRRSCAQSGVLLTLCFAVVILGFMTVQGLISQANANWAAAAYVSATVAVVALMDVPRWRPLLAASLALHLAIAAAVPLVEPVGRAAGLWAQADRDPFRRQRGWEDLIAQLDEVREAHGNLPLAVDERRYIAAVMYHSDADLQDIYSWNVDRTIDHHYDLLADADAMIGADLLLVTRWVSREFGPHFDRVEPLPTISVATHDDGELFVYLAIGRNFRGYAVPEDQ